MREVVETYRGVVIYKSAAVFCDPNVAAKVPQPCEAEVDGWRLIGSLDNVKEEIDKKLGPTRADSKF